MPIPSPISIPMSIPMLIPLLSPSIPGLRRPGKERAPHRQAEGEEVRTILVLRLQGAGRGGVRLHFRAERDARLHASGPAA